MSNFPASASAINAWIPGRISEAPERPLVTAAADGANVRIAVRLAARLEEVRERYSKHVRAIVQVGEERSADHSMPLGYPIEILLDQNPYDLDLGDELSFRVLFKGKPVNNQIVRVSHERFDGGDSPHGNGNAYMLRTDEEGRARFILNDRAVWYIALIHMQQVDDAEVDYESNWATVTFEVE